MLHKTLTYPAFKGDIRKIHYSPSPGNFKHDDIACGIFVGNWRTNVRSLVTCRNCLRTHALANRKTAALLSKLEKEKE